MDTANTDTLQPHRFSRPTQTPQHIQSPPIYIHICSPGQAQAQPQAQAPQIKSVAERRLLKPFGKALDTKQNTYITTYGEDVYIEYNPAVFIGKSSAQLADTYLQNVITAYATNTALDTIITLKPEFDVAARNGASPSTSTSTSTNLTEKYDWWGDVDINNKIEQHAMANKTYEQTYKHLVMPKLSVYELIPEFMEKIQIANKLIHDLQIGTHRDGIPLAHQTVKFRDLSAAPARFAPVKRAARLPYSQGDDAHTHMSDNNNYSDNYSIRISNFTNAAVLTSYMIYDVLNEFISTIQYKVFIPRNRETNQNKEFAFINFLSDVDMHAAFNLLTKQRIFMDSAILYIELSKKK